MLNLRWRPMLASAILIALAASPLPHTVRDAFAVLALAAVATAAWTPENAVVMLVVYLPFRILVEAMAPTPITFVVDVIVLTLVARVVYLHADRLLPFDIVEWLALAFGAWGLLASIHGHAHLGAAVLELRDLLLFVLLYAAVRRLRQADDGIAGDWWSRIVPFALASVAIVGAQGMIETFVLSHAFLLPGKLVHQIPLSGVNYGRPYGWVDNPNAFGELGFLALAIAYDHFRRRAFQPTVLAALTLAFFATMVVLSFSRSAYLVVLVAAGIFLYGTPKRIERAGIVLGVVVMALAVAAIPGARARTVGRGPLGPAATVSHTVHGHAGTAKLPRPRTTTKKGKAGPCPAGANGSPLSAGYLCASARAGRLYNLKVALSVAKHHPFGTGLGTFGSAGAKAFHVHLKGLPKSFYADNQYAVVLVETGIIGLLLFALFGLGALWTAMGAAGDERRRLAIVLFVALGILGATSNALEQLVLTVYPWLALAGLAAASSAVPRLRGMTRVSPSGTRTGA